MQVSAFHLVTIAGSMDLLHTYHSTCVKDFCQASLLLKSQRAPKAVEWKVAVVALEPASVDETTPLVGGQASYGS
jgi:hypothetical protein